jgi:hypothetical protein
MKTKLQVGDTVLYEGDKYTIEKDYGNDVYFIGSKDAFVEMVNASQLKRV